tara:strand:+ start:942 stop:1154 length:213 start_codon:yes stop_codon:yes gene_type:complete
MPALTHGRAADNYNFAGPSNPNKNFKVYKQSSIIKTDASRKKAIPGGIGTSNLAKRAYALRSKVSCCDKK